MKIKIFLFILIFIAFHLGSYFGFSLYYDYKSVVCYLITPPMQEIAAGVFSSLFTLIVVMIYYKITKKRIVRHYIISIMITYLIQFIAEWKVIGDFDIVALDAVIPAIFINIEFVTFCIVSYLVLKTLGFLNPRL